MPPRVRVEITPVMERTIPESDWKVLRQLHPIALDRFCRRLLSEIEQILSDASQASHARYLKIYELIDQRNEEMSGAFDDMRRSMATLRIASIRYHGLFTEEEFARFSPETRAGAELIVKLNRS